MIVFWWRMGCWAAGSQIKSWRCREGKCGSGKNKTRISLSQFSHWSWFPSEYREKFLPQRISGTGRAPQGLGTFPNLPELQEPLENALRVRFWALGSMILVCPSAQDIPLYWNYRLIILMIILLYILIFHDLTILTHIPHPNFPTTPQKSPMGNSETSKALSHQGAIPRGKQTQLQNYSWI